MEHLCVANARVTAPLKPPTKPHLHHSHDVCHVEALPVVELKETVWERRGRGLIPSASAHSHERSLPAAMLACAC